MVDAAHMRLAANTLHKASLAGIGSGADRRLNHEAPRASVPRGDRLAPGQEMTSGIRSQPRTVVVGASFMPL